MKLSLLALLCLVGCAVAPEMVTPADDMGGNEAARIVWQDVWNSTDAAPSVVAVTGADLNCGDGAGFMDEGVCVDGAINVVTRRARIALPAGARWSDTSLAEMLCEAKWGAELPDACTVHGGVERIDTGNFVLRNRGF